MKWLRSTIADWMLVSHRSNSLLATQNLARLERRRAVVDE